MSDATSTHPSARASAKGRAQQPVRRIGFIGLGDQGLPMATAIADAGFELHAWARRPTSLEGLADVGHVAHATAEDLARSCDVIALCVSEDSDVVELVATLLPATRTGAVIINHGTGTPATATSLAQLCATHGVHCVDAPVSGGRPGALERRLTTMVGGPAEVVERVRPVFDSFSAQVVHLGDAGSGQMAKLFNNAMLILNQATIADVFKVAAAAGVDTVRLARVLAFGSASSSALTLFGSMITTDNVAHLSAVEDLDVDIFETAMHDAGVDATEIIARAHHGANAMTSTLTRITGKGVENL